MRPNAPTASCCLLCCLLVQLAVLAGCAVSPPPAGNDNAAANANTSVNANQNANVNANANDNTAVNTNDNVAANANANVNANDNVPAGGCVMDEECADGQVCVNSECRAAPLAEPSAEFGYTQSATGNYRAVGEGEVMPLFTLGQGGGHVFLTMRLTGFGPPVNGVVGAFVSQKVEFVEEGGVLVLHDFTQAGALPFHESPVGSGVFELTARFVFLDVIPTYIDGQTLAFTFTFTQHDNPDISVTIKQNMIVQMGAD